MWTLSKRRYVLHNLINKYLSLILLILPIMHPLRGWRIGLAITTIIHPLRGYDYGYVSIFHTTIFSNAKPQRRNVFCPWITRITRINTNFHKLYI
jgi:hypothetical protein